MAETYRKQTVKQLRDLLKDRNIPSTGLTKKEQIIAKLVEHDDAETATATTTEEPPTAEATSVDPHPAEPTNIDPSPAEPTPIEPSAAEPTPIEPPTAEPTSIEPSATEPTPIEPPAAESPTPAGGDAVEDGNKRKRRSLTPPVAEEDVAIKKARHETDGVHLKEDAAQEPQQAETAIGTRNTPSTQPTQTPSGPNPPPSIEPAMHRPTNALYIGNLVRPLQQTALQQYLETLANGSLSFLHLDTIKSHAFAVFDSEPTATAVRAALHSKIWPAKDTWRQPLHVDYIPEAKAQEWADEEKKADPDGVKNLSWVVRYQANAFGHITAFHVSAADRNFGAASAGPVSTRQRRTEETNQTPIKTLDELFQHTDLTKPKVYFQEVSKYRQEARRNALRDHKEQHRGRKVVFRFDEYDRLRVSEPGVGGGGRGRGGFNRGGRRGGYDRR